MRILRNKNLSYVIGLILFILCLIEFVGLSGFSQIQFVGRYIRYFMLGFSSFISLLILLRISPEENKKSFNLVQLLAFALPIFTSLYTFKLVDFLSYKSVYVTLMIACALISLISAITNTRTVLFLTDFIFALALGLLILFVFNTVYIIYSLTLTLFLFGLIFMLGGIFSRKKKKESKKKDLRKDSTGEFKRIE